MIALGPQACGDLEDAAAREWLVADGLGGYAMGTVAGLRTRRYHGLLAVAAGGPAARMLGLAALDPVLVVGDARYRLATDEWAAGVVDPRGHELLVVLRASTAVCRAGAGRSATSCSSARSRWRTGAARWGSSTGWSAPTVRSRSS